MIDGERKYLVEWKGYPQKEDRSWEPVANVDCCKDLLAEFRKRCADARNRRRAQKWVDPQKEASRRKTL